MAEEGQEVRAARNQSLFRSVNEKLEHLNEPFGTLDGNYTIVCECADLTCIRTLDIEARRYLAVRENPRQFVVFSDHVYPEVESVVARFDGYVIVEKEDRAGEVAEASDASARG
jgi:5-bromo-4-chloroindolyl phosphate hydrolysis protein